jgi:uncharacterized protein YbjT (DUF2867 family)
MVRKQKVLVAGATGYLGRYAVREFKRRGFWVRVLARNPEKLKVKGPFMEPAIDHLHDDLFVVEITRQETLRGLCDDIDIVFSSIGITRQRDGVSFMDVDYRGNKNLLSAALNSGVSKFVFVSVFKADQITHLAEAREMFVNDLKQSGLPYAILRPTGYFSDMSEYLKMARSGRVLVLGSGRNKINPIHGRDLAEVCVDSADHNHRQTEKAVGGPRTYTYDEIGSLAFDVLGKKKKIIHIPLWLVQQITNVLRLFNSHRYQVARFFTTVMGNDFVAPKAGSYRLERYFEEMSEQI